MHRIFRPTTDKICDVARRYSGSRSRCVSTPPDREGASIVAGWADFGDWIEDCFNFNKPGARPSSAGGDLSASRKGAEAAFDAFIETYDRKYEKVIGPHRVVRFCTAREGISL